MVPNPAHHPLGDFFLEGDGRLHAEHPTLPVEQRFTFSGIGVYDPRLFSHTPPQQPAKLAPLLREAMAQQQVVGALHQGEWIDVGTPERLAALEGKIMASSQTQR